MGRPCLSKEVRLQLGVARRRPTRAANLIQHLHRITAAPRPFLRPDLGERALRRVSPDVTWRARSKPARYRRSRPSCAPSSIQYILCFSCSCRRRCSNRLSDSSSSRAARWRSSTCCASEGATLWVLAGAWPVRLGCLAAFAFAVRIVDG